MFAHQIPILLRGPARSPTLPVGGGKITFSDPAIGTNGNPPNPAIWTPDQSGWQYDGAGHYYYNGATYSYLSALCTNGDNILQADINTGPFAFSIPGFVIRYVDSSNYVMVYKDDSAGWWALAQSVGGSFTTLANGGALGMGNQAYTVSIANVGNTITVTFSAGASNNGSFSLGGVTALSTATHVAIAANLGKPDLIWTNISLA